MNRGLLALDLQTNNKLQVNPATCTNVFVWIMMCCVMLYMEEWAGISRGFYKYCLGIVCEGGMGENVEGDL